MSTLQDEYFDAYKEHSKTLRTWLVAYGIGAPVLFVTNATVAAKFTAAPPAVSIASFFLAGVVVQVLLAVLNKSVNWASYYAEGHTDASPKWLFAAARWVCDQFWIDLVLDLVSLVLFAIATWRSLQVLIAAG